MSEIVFIGGSRRISRFNDIIQEGLRLLVADNVEILVGDANGADKATQKYLAEIDYQPVTVYYAGGVCRNNIAGWKTKRVEPTRKTKDYKFYAAKDFEMSKEADRGLMLWDGKSTGTVNNVLNLLDEGKSARVYVSFDDDFTEVSSFEDLRKLLSICVEDDIEVMERKLELSKRLNSSQAELPLS